ncbi:acylphosphatase [Methylobacterium sp. JK268]
MAAKQIVRAIVRGRVQGVGFRAWTREAAAARDLSGFVRNREDGSVEVVLCGEPEAVAAVMEALRHGPAGARVTELAAEDLAEVPPPGFAILRG